MASLSFSALDMAGERGRGGSALEEDGRLGVLQSAFVEQGAVQCGYCTPGMIMSAAGLLNRTPDPTEEEIRVALSGNICRCSGYVQIVAAVKAAAEILRQEGKQ